MSNRFMIHKKSPLKFRLHSIRNEYLEKQAPGTLLDIILSSLSIGRDLNAKLSIFNFSKVAMCLLTALKNLYMHLQKFCTIG